MQEPNRPRIEANLEEGLSITHTNETPELKTARLVQTRKEAQERLDKAAETNPDNRGESQVAQNILKLYGADVAEVADLTPTQTARLALSHIAHDLFITEMFQPDGSESHILSLSSPDTHIEPEEYRFIGDSRSHITEKLREKIGNTKFPSGSSPIATSQKDPRQMTEDEIFTVYSQLTSQEGKPGIIVVPGKPILTYNHVEIQPGEKFDPPFGGQENNVCVFELVQ